MGQVRRYRPGHSPFDAIRRFNDDDEEYWSAREIAAEFGYSRWEDMLQVIRRAKIACRTNGRPIEKNFRDAPKVSTQPSGRQQVTTDVQMSRYGAYMVALSGDNRKPVIAAAKHYFAEAARAAELAAATPPVWIDARPWSLRFSETTGDHFSYMATHHPDHFSVISAAGLHMLKMEEELILHLLPIRPGDLPDGSIGQRWANHRRKRNLPPATLRAPLLLPSRGIEAMVLIYPNSELGDFLSWLLRSYIPEHLPDYYKNKREFRPYGQLPSASAADHTSKKMVGKPAKIDPKLRHQLESLGGFCPASPSALNDPQAASPDGLD